MNSVNYFDSIADNWNVIRSEYFNETLKYLVLSKVNIKDKICADLGCGTGFISLALSLEAELVFSVDSSKNMLKELSGTTSKKAMKNIHPIIGSMDSIPLFDNSIDAAFTNMALHHVVDAKKVISEMYRILKSNGTAVVSDVKEHNGLWAKEEMFDEWLGFSEAQIRQWMTEAGFVDIEFENTELSCKGYSSKGEFTETGIFIAKGRKGANE